MIGVYRGTLDMGEVARLSFVLAIMTLQALTMAGASPSQTRYENLGDRFGMGLNGLGSGFLPLLCFTTTWIDFANYAPATFQFWTGLGLSLAGLTVFWRAHQDLGRNFSKFVEIKQDHKLITTGIYRYVRHPLYAGLVLLAAGQGFLIANWLVGPAALIGFLVVYLLRIPNEEAVLEAKFGQEYTDYAQQTGRLFPRLLGAGPAR